MKTKILKTTILMMLVMLVVFAEASYAVEIEPFELEPSVELKPYFMFMTLRTYDKGHPEAEGEKFGAGFGAKFSFLSFEKWFKQTYGVEIGVEIGGEIWGLGEPTDNDREMASDGRSFFVTFSHDFLLCADTVLYPLVELGYGMWRRNSRNSPNPDIENVWGEFQFLDVLVGLGLKHDIYNVKAGCMRSFWSKTDSDQEPEGKLGLTFDIGAEVHKDINVGFFYRLKRFEGDGSQGDFGLEQRGIMVTYIHRFK